MGDGGTNSLISFAVDSMTIRVRDEPEGQELEFHVTTDELEVKPALPDLFLFPVDNAITVTVSEIRVSIAPSTSVWNENGEYLDEFTTEPKEFSTGTYFVQLSQPVNCYLRIYEAPFSGVVDHIESSSVPLELTFPEPTQVTIGARSLHTSPQATITVPDEPAKMLEAIAYLGSSIKEFSCERSWPSIRGHPPAIEVGDRLEVPNELSKPETGVTITVPPHYADLYRVAPLAFYLGATLEEGEKPELRLENGYVEPLRTPSRSLEDRVDELLGTCLVLDSLVRIGGYYSHPRYEYDQLAQQLPFYPPHLYDESLSDQLIEFLEIPFKQLEPYVPEWPMTAIVRPRSTDVELVPYALHSLSRIHVDEGESQSSSEVVNGKTAAALQKSDTAETEPLSSQLWCYADSRPPTGAGCLIPAAFEAGITRTISDVTTAQFAYVTRQRSSRIRRTIEALDGETILEADTVTVVAQPTPDELERTLETGYDFLYCDLPISNVSEGVAFECEDEFLWVDELERVGTKTFVVGGSGSFVAARALAQRGAFAGAALESSARPTQIIRLMENLLRGHLLVGGLKFAGISETTTWRFVGDPSRPTIRREGGSIPHDLHIESVNECEHELSLRFQPTDILGLGSVGSLLSENTYDTFQLNGLRVSQPTTISADEVVKELEDTDHVARLNGEVYHGETDATEFVRDSIRRTLTDNLRSDHDLPRDDPPAGE